MWCGVISLFPEMFAAVTQAGVVGRAMKNGILSLATWNPRDYAEDHYGTVDDRPYGGGPGMVMMAPVLSAALSDAKRAAPEPPRVVYVTPAGKLFDHHRARALAAQKQPLIFISGRYEGVDHRFIAREVDEQISIGDYVLSGGELPVMVILDALARWLPGVLGHEDSASWDAFAEENGGLLDCPHYTRPAIWDGVAVPPVLLTGNHQAIARWRRKQAVGQTWLHRPDLLEKITLDESCRELLAEFQQEYAHYEEQP